MKHILLWLIFILLAAHGSRAQTADTLEFWEHCYARYHNGYSGDNLTNVRQYRDSVLTELDKRTLIIKNNPDLTDSAKALLEWGTYLDFFSLCQAQAQTIDGKKLAK